MIDKLDFTLKMTTQNKPKIVARLAHIAIELGEYDINFISRSSVKDQAMEKFVAKFSDSPKVINFEGLEKCISIRIVGKNMCALI